MFYAGFICSVLRYVFFHNICYIFKNEKYLNSTFINIFIALMFDTCTLAKWLLFVVRDKSNHYRPSYIRYFKRYHTNV